MEIMEYVRFDNPKFHLTIIENSLKSLKEDLKPLDVIHEIQFEIIKTEFKKIDAILEEKMFIIKQSEKKIEELKKELDDKDDMTF